MHRAHLLRQWVGCVGIQCECSFEVVQGVGGLSRCVEDQPGPRPQPRLLDALANCTRRVFDRFFVLARPGQRPSDGDIVGQKVTVSINELFSEHEKYLILEVETSATEDGASRRIASVTATYDNLSTGKRDKISAITSAHFTKSKEVAAKSVDKKAMADAVMQIAVLNNERATKLRDEGKIDLAIRVIDGNTMYLYSNADSLSSEELRSYGHINAFQGANFDDANWGKNRKEMRESQSVWRIQQKR